MLAAVLGAGVPTWAATLFITNTKSESVSIIDTDTLEVVGTIPLGGGKPNRIVFHLAGPRRVLARRQAPLRLGRDRGRRDRDRRRRAGGRHARRPRGRRRNGARADR